MTVTMAGVCEGEASDDGPTLAAPFEYKALTDAIAQREKAEAALREYIRRVRE